MDGYVKLAQEINKRNNPVRLGICVGTVIGLAPVTVQTYYKGVAFDFTRFYSLMGLMNDETGITEGELFVDEYPYEIGDQYICMFSEDNQSIYILGKFESIKDLYIYLNE